MTRFSAPGALMLAAILTLAACASDSDTGSTQPSVVDSISPTTSPSNTLAPTGTVEGVVIDVEGTLGSVASFTLRLSNGTDAVFVPEDGVLFDGTAPIDHVRDHMVSGAPVRVDYTTLEAGTLSALEVGDA